MSNCHVTLQSTLSGDNNGNLSVFQNVCYSNCPSVGSSCIMFIFFFSSINPGANQKVKIMIFAVVHYIAVGMTNTASLEFNIGKMTMQLL